MAASWPASVVRVERLLTSTPTRWRKLMLSRSERLARSVRSSYEPRSTYSNTARATRFFAICLRSSMQVTTRMAAHSTMETYDEPPHHCFHCGRQRRRARRGQEPDPGDRAHD